ncbi:hypothetical protein SETIT_7G318700v2 [Setaria italica]|uniref:Uncharacterized protein n=1 Tax=Setaria italica TaxID=4555 RepID=A0A368S1Z5_SETIT|nr:hypothetical protein SETIT_7G318700v2 [Setaria italica]
MYNLVSMFTDVIVSHNVIYLTWRDQMHYKLQSTME